LFVLISSVDKEAVFVCQDNPWRRLYAGRLFGVSAGRSQQHHSESVSSHPSHGTT